MKYFIVVSEDDYGGRYNDVAVFDIREKAEEYVRGCSDNKDRAIVEKECPETTFTMVVVSEEYYGGDNIAIFNNIDTAHRYCDDLIEKNGDKTDYVVLYRHVQ